MEQKHFSKSLGITAGILIPLCIVVVSAYFFIQKSKEEKPWKPEKEVYSLNETINYGSITISNVSFVSPYGNGSPETLNAKIKTFDEETNKLREKYGFEYKTNSIKEYGQDPLYNEDLQTEEFKQLKKENDQNEIELLKTQLSAIKLTIKNSYDNKNDIVTNNSQYVIRDGDKIIKTYNINPLPNDPRRQLDELNWGINKTLKSGEETSGYIFFKETNFQNPTLEINPINGSYPIKIELN